MEGEGELREPLGHISFNLLILSTKISQMGSKLKKKIKYTMFLKDLLLMGWALMLLLLLWGCFCVEWVLVWPSAPIQR